MPVASSGSHLCFWPTKLKRFPLPPPQVRGTHRTQGNATDITSLLKNMIKDTEEQPDEEIHRVRSGRVPGSEALSSWSLDVPLSQVDVFTNLLFESPTPSLHILLLLLSEHLLPPIFSCFVHHCISHHLEPHPAHRRNSTNSFLKDWLN